MAKTVLHFPSNPLISNRCKIQCFTSKPLKKNKEDRTLTPLILVRIQVPQPASPISHLLSCDTQKIARLRAISQVRSQSPLTDLGDSTGFEAAVSKRRFLTNGFR